jgi:hypothetical protein
VTARSLIRDDSLDRSEPTFGGVLDSTLGWIVSLPVEREGRSENAIQNKINGNYEEMPLAA